MSQLLQVSAGQFNCSESVSQSPFCLYKLGMAADVFSPIATDSAQFQGLPDALPDVVCFLILRKWVNWKGLIWDVVATQQEQAGV